MATFSAEALARDCFSELYVCKSLNTTQLHSFHLRETQKKDDQKLRAEYFLKTYFREILQSLSSDKNFYLREIFVHKNCETQINVKNEFLYILEVS